MIEPLYEKVIERKDEIRKYFDTITDHIDKEKVRKEYQPHKFKDKKQDKCYAAIDGSFNKKRFMAGYVYALSSQTIVSRPQENILKESATGDLNVISTIQHIPVDQVLSTRMNILELKSTIDTLKKHEDIDYMLMDGSLRGTLLNFQTNFELPEKIVKYLVGKSTVIEKELSEDKIKLDVTTERLRNELLVESEEILKDTEYDVSEIINDIYRYFEGLEQILCIHHILSRYKEKIICVSKTSSTKSLFNESIPDAAVIEYLYDEAGYTKPTPQNLNKPVRHTTDNKIIVVNFPVKSSSLTDNTFTTLFTKLENRSNVLKIEVPSSKNEEEMIEILEDLKSISLNGYPYILIKAHEEVKIRSKEMDRMILNLELINEKTGRDMLNK